MPDFCAAFGCSNERNAKTKVQGITFHRFPKDEVKRQAWTVALRRRYFKPNDRSVLCSCHFKSEDFDMTGQTTRLKEGAIPSFPDYLCKLPSTSRSSRTSQKSAAQCPDVHVRLSEDLQESVNVFNDHQYVLDPVKVKKLLTAAQEKMEEFERDIRNAKDCERRYESTAKSLQAVLKRKNMPTEELQKKLDFYSGWLNCLSLSFLTDNFLYLFSHVCDWFDTLTPMIPELLCGHTASARTIWISTLIPPGPIVPQQPLKDKRRQGLPADFGMITPSIYTDSPNYDDG